MISLKKTNNIKLSLKEKIGQLFMIGFYGKELPERVENFIINNNIGFIILFSRNIESALQVVELTNRIHSIGKVTPFLYTDQEGGTVVQFKEIAATVISHMGIAATYNKKNARIAGRIIGEEMDALGIDGVFAPVLDVNYEENNPIIGIRSFSDKPDIVINFAKEFFFGLNEGGVTACGKHYPGHGGTTKDSHLEIPKTYISSEYFLHYCFKPFAELAKIKIDSIMSSHVLFPNISGKIATFSPYFINELLRKKTGYNGVVFSDCVEMKAIKDNFSPEEIVKNSINAGIDVMVASHDFDLQKELLEVLLFYVKKGFIKEKRIDASISRILNLKKRYFNDIEKKIRDKENISIKLRSNIKLERKIADNSITLLRNKMRIIPIDKNKKALILEWEKVKATSAIQEAENVSMLGPIGKKYLKNVDIKILKLNEKIPKSLGFKLEEYSYVIAGVYSRNLEIEKIQGNAIKKIIKLRKDLIVVALGNPYDIRNFPSVNTYIATYGFRMVQLESLFKIIIGKIKPHGKLPVRIRDIFPRGYGL